MSGSKSQYREILRIGKEAAADTGLIVTDRFFVPTGAARSGAWMRAMSDGVTVLCLLSGMLMLFLTGFHLASLSWLYGASFAIVLCLTAVFSLDWCRRHAIVLVLGGTLFWFLALLLLQERMSSGGRHLLTQIILKINQVYRGELHLVSAGGSWQDAGIFLLLILIPIASYLFFAVSVKNRTALVVLLLLPFVTVMALLGAAKSAAALFLLFFGMLLSLSLEQTVKRRRMMGRGREAIFRQNAHRWERIRFKSAALVLSLSLFLSVPSFYIVRPFLALSLSPAEAAAMRLQNNILGQVIRLLPAVTAGAYHLNVETLGGGVLDGALIDDEKGYSFHDIEDLKVTVNAKPKERLFLKGFIGGSYENNEWKPPFETSFDGAAMNWRVDQNARLYLQNLPFLRLSYAAGQMGEALTPTEMTVERINANDSYTYLPYGTYLNDYYEVSHGDGAVTGQSEQEDRYFFYSREALSQGLARWNEEENTANVLDRIEESYRVFCTGEYTAVAEGLEELQDLTASVAKEKNWEGSKNAEEIEAWIRKYLSENFAYSMDASAGTDEKSGDFLTDFLFHTKEGYSVHFASAGVELFRMFGIPARYVVGYEVSEQVFAPQADGTFTAILEDDNSQAWTEIYLSGIGWMPVDLTPGTIGTLEEVGGDGQKITSFDENDGADGSLTEESEEEATPLEMSVMSRLGTMSVADIIHGFIGVIGAAASAAFLIGIWHHLYIILGIDPFGRRGAKKCVIGIFRAFSKRIHYLGLPDEIDSENEAFVAFSEKCLNGRKRYRAGELERCLRHLYGACYGNERLTKSDVAAFRRLYGALPHFRWQMKKGGGDEI